MHSALRRFLIRLYPQAWRKRYGAEFEVLLEDSGSGNRVILDVLKEGISMRVQSGDFRYIVAFAMAGLLIAGVISFSIPNRYRSTAVVEVRNAPGASRQSLKDSVIQAEVAALSRTSLSNLIRTLNLYPSERARMPIEDVIKMMKTRDLRIDMSSTPKRPDNSAFQVAFTGGDRFLASRVTASLTQSLFAALASQSRDVRILDSASLPTTPLSPNRLTISIAGSVAGLFSGLLLIRWRRLRQARTTAATAN
jgi:uncharacterized protein involved in exopolysaccharide biosynthesis